MGNVSIRERGFIQTVTTFRVGIPAEFLSNGDIVSLFSNITSG